jgi:hypothetical protein
MIFDHKRMVNGITCTHRATGQLVEIPLNYKEMQLALDNSDTLLDSWSLLIDMLKERLDMTLQGNYELETITVNKKTRPLH